MSDPTPGPAPAESRWKQWRDRLRAAALRVAGWVRRHPWRAAAVLPLLVLAWVLALIPLTPGIGDLRKFRTEVPAMVLASDGAVIAEYRRVNRRWVPLEGI